MNRDQRRKAAKKGVTHKDLKAIDHQALARGIDFTASAIMASLALVLHDQLGFGQTRALRVMKQVEEMFDSVSKGYVTIEDLKKTVKEELDIDLK